MRFRKGEKVEVMNHNVAPISWCVAEILSGNGHTYCVQYDSYPEMASEQLVETVPKKFVRPCPPVMPGVESCTAGDIVEVFYEYAWKLAAVLKILEGKNETRSNRIHLAAASVQTRILVRLLGSSQELIVDKSNIRMRQTWHDGKWILVGKSSVGGEDDMAIKLSTSNCYQKMNFHTLQTNSRPKRKLQQGCTNIQDMISSRSLKRMSTYDSTIMEEHNGHIKKLRAAEKDASEREKVHAVAYPREILGEQDMHDPVKVISIGFYQTERPNIRISELNSSDSDACSVGSCSITDQSPNNYFNGFTPCQEIDTLSSDAESCYGSSSERKSSSIPQKEEIQVRIHTLELQAYRRTLEALYASGPLSWEQEALLTNLRIVLHISNDEHLMELKNLISAKTSVNVR